MVVKLNKCTRTKPGLFILWIGKAVYNNNIAFRILDNFRNFQRKRLF